MRILLPVLLVLHGFAHLVGFFGAFHLSAEIPAHPDLFGGRMHLGGAGEKTYGVLWGAGALAFLVLALGVLSHAAWWPAATLGAAFASALLCLSDWHAARVGFYLDLALLAFVALGLRTGWLAPYAG